MTTRRMLMAAAGVLVAAAMTSPAAAQTKMVMKAADVHPLGYPTVEAVVRMGKKLEKATNGRLSVQMFPSMQLGGEKEMIEQAQIGALQIRPHQRRPGRLGGRRPQRLQHAFRVPQHHAYAQR